ncbi:Lrp/AsnC family transcriptional regulator [Pararobbsia silviterrae]|uniref:Lrp/AsnC family transcriptional regulator n=1 Tax=Pararobbsia silviterrae TaxID=1792498 RepID=A0A494Y4Z7_9BURK|nr:Lrp/AsnC family transcriptional regulator [Pararobbsia silviterrae]RKP57779.1 Lrp/AsnC family transcriptional regulator [Pararobbsia silviterrae]
MPQSISYDAIDLKILDQLQRDGSLSIADLAERVSLSTTPCWRRVQRLEAEGTLLRRVALLDPDKLNLKTTAFVSIKSPLHSKEWLTAFRRAVHDIPEIVEVHRMSGHIDYLLKVLVPDIGLYDDVYQRLIHMINLLDVSSSFSMEVLKQTTTLPLDYVGPGRGE